MLISIVILQPHSGPTLCYPVSGAQASSRGGLDIRFPALPPGGAETWPENKGNKTSEYCSSVRMVIMTWDHFKHLQLGSELEWREATGKTGVPPGRASGKATWFGEPFLSSPSRHSAQLLPHS